MHVADCDAVLVSDCSTLSEVDGTMPVADSCTMPVDDCGVHCL